LLLIHVAERIFHLPHTTQCEGVENTLEEMALDEKDDVQKAGDVIAGKKTLYASYCAESRGKSAGHPRAWDNLGQLRSRGKDSFFLNSKRAAKTRFR